MKKRTIFIALPVLIILLVTIYGLRPISTSTLEDTEVIQGNLVSIGSNEKTRDISLKIEGYDKNYYINRGLDGARDIVNLSSEMVRSEVEIFYAKHWTPLDPFGKNKHVSRIVWNGDLIYDEINK
ncbi:hypothetical protein SAMN04488057_11898 [Cyclobacterium lianum]|uniref:Uncharacterized protein n=1 Tax=Cyclobacterium lianum TaxID=388280 RepID=A0A1M7QIC9_9BACT|nr:hypothetical protein [Cyclobacterium lianum]SHN30925.1 hypothetical protein SAMN04488057_11898 [Cyclobacterium lianum]